MFVKQNCLLELTRFGGRTLVRPSTALNKLIECPALPAESLPRLSDLQL